jgi:hypothetical protein
MRNKNHNIVMIIICLFVIAVCSLFIACFSPLAGEDPSKGTIILNFGGVPETSRAATMGNLQYSVTLYNADKPGDNGTEYGTKSGTSFCVTVDPGNYRIRLTAYLNGALYAEGETDGDTPIRVTAGSNSCVTITLKVDISAYLDDEVFKTSSVNSIDLPLAITLSSDKWDAILTAIRDSDKPVNLDLSQCRANGTDLAGGSSNISSLILPNDIEIISTSAFSDFSMSGSLTIPAGVFIGIHAFEQNNFSEIFVGDNCDIGELAFKNCMYLSSVTIGGGSTIGNNAFYECYEITSVTIGAGGVACTPLPGAGLPSTGIHGGFDSFADPTTNTIPAGTYTWVDEDDSWSYVPLP